MNIRFTSALLALALPILAQDAATQPENIFYKAFYLEKGTRDFAGAMALYEQFLTVAPTHKLAMEAAKQEFALLDKTGKNKERDAFRVKYEKLLGNAVAVGTGATDAPRPAGEAGERGERGERGEGRAPGAGGRMDPAARLAELEKQIAAAKAEGNEEQVKTLTQRLERMKQMAAGGGAGGRGPGGQGGPGGGRMGGMRALFGNTKLADMKAEDIATLKESVDAMEGVPEMMKQALSEEQVKTFETSLETLKKGLADNKLEDAQKALDAMKAVMPQRRQRGGGGDAGGQGAGGGRGGRGGNNGGGGGF
jgi:hypothetical protein